VLHRLRFLAHPVDQFLIVAGRVRLHERVRLPVVLRGLLAIAARLAVRQSAVDRTKRPGGRGARNADYFRVRQRRPMAIPARPRPTKASEAGSGTEKASVPGKRPDAE
jgi:hypothetical protein